MTRYTLKFITSYGNVMASCDAAEYSYDEAIRKAARYASTSYTGNRYFVEPVAPRYALLVAYPVTSGDVKGLSSCYDRSLGRGSTWAEVCEDFRLASEEEAACMMQSGYGMEHALAYTVVQL